MSLGGGTEEELGAPCRTRTLTEGRALDRPVCVLSFVICVVCQHGPGPSRRKPFPGGKRSKYPHSVDNLGLSCRFFD